MTATLAGKRALVIGSNSGIGEAIGPATGEAGTDVVPTATGALH